MVTSGHEAYSMTLLEGLPDLHPSATHCVPLSMHPRYSLHLTVVQQIFNVK